VWRDAAKQFRNCVIRYFDIAIERLFSVSRPAIVPIAREKYLPAA
jgi:hypothetical protein